MNKSLLDELKSFAAYFASVWGILSAFTLSFPLLNNLWRVVRLPHGPAVTSETWSVLSTLCGIYVVYVIFTNRRRNVAMFGDTSSVFFFIAGMLTTILYLVVLPSWPNVGLDDLVTSGQLPGAIAFLIATLQAFLGAIEPLLYLAITSLLTASSAKPAVQEWHERQASHPATPF